MSIKLLEASMSSQKKEVEEEDGEGEEEEGAYVAFEYMQVISESKCWLIFQA